MTGGPVAFYAATLPFFCGYAIEKAKRLRGQPNVPSIFLLRQPAASGLSALSVVIGEASAAFLLSFYRRFLSAGLSVHQ